MLLDCGHEWSTVSKIALFGILLSPCRAPVGGLFEFPDSLEKTNSPKFGSGGVRGAGASGPGPHSMAFLTQEEAGGIGCLGVEYRRGSTGGSSSSICGPIAAGSATYSKVPLPSLDDPLAQRPSWLSVPSEKFWNL